MNNKVLISSYNKFDVLAHIPKGIESKYSLSCNTKYYSFNLCENPAFILKHPELDFFYICCESIFGGKIGTFSYKDNELKEVSYVDSCGKSSCYLTFDDNNENIININYWNYNLIIDSYSKKKNKDFEKSFINLFFLTKNNQSKNLDLKKYFISNYKLFSEKNKKIILDNY